MADEKKSGTCDQCKKNVVVFRAGTNHILHLILSVITLGIWLIPWLLSCVKFGGWRCQECGSSDISKVN